MSLVFTATKNILNDKKYMFIFVLLWSVLFSGMFYLPIATVPGNDVAFQAKLFTMQDYILLTVFAGISALIIAMQLKIFALTRHANFSHGLLGAASGFVSAFFGTATCTLCLGAMVSLLGAGTIFILVEYRGLLVASSAILVLASLYFSSKRLVEGCESCRIDTTTLK